MMTSSDKILGFQGEYRWLSNMWPCEVTVDGRVFPSSEHAYVYAKLKEDPDGSLYDYLVTLPPRKSKSWGRKVEIREGWEDVRDGVMYNALWSKFNDNEDLKQKLIETGDAYIEETNDWHDTYYGVCNGVGQNKLGKMLMSIRNEFKWI